MQKITRLKLDEAISAYAHQGLTLEIGSYGTSDYKKYFANRIGVDIRPGKGVDQLASVYALPFPDNHFDNILCISVLEHLVEPQKAITEMQRVLKKNGKIIVSVPFLFPIHDAPNDYWRFTKYGLQILFKDWRIIDLKGETNAQESLASLLQRLGFQSDIKMRYIFKTLIYLMSYILFKLPYLFKNIYGDIRKTKTEKDAFSGAFFLVAEKIS